MADVFLDFRPRVGWSEKRRLEKAIQNVGPDDQLVIMVETPDAHQTDGLFDVLDHYGFNYQPKTGGGNSEIYNIIARRKVSED